MKMKIPGLIPQPVSLARIIAVGRGPRRGVVDVPSADHGESNRRRKAKRRGGEEGSIVGGEMTEKAHQSDGGCIAQRTEALISPDAAVVGVMMPLVIADLTRGTGRYNLAQGFAGTATGIGAALSTACSGYAVELFGYAAAFLGLAAIGLAGAALLYWLFPETKIGHPHERAVPVGKNR